jgi:hypothetical protein
VRLVYRTDGIEDYDNLDLCPPLAVMQDSLRVTALSGTPSVSNHQSQVHAHSAQVLSRSESESNSDTAVGSSPLPCFAARA